MSELNKELVRRFYMAEGWELYDNSDMARQMQA